MRKRLALKSSAIGLTAKIITTFLSVICTRVFMKELGVEIRGIDGLLTNCLSLLQLTEMGIGTAVIYALYKPLADNNIKEIQILMRLYKKIYRYVGALIMLAGIAMSLFLKFFIEETTFPWSYVLLVYFMQVFSTACTYFYSYKRSLLYADQRMYITTLIDAICTSIATGIKIVIMIWWKSYIAYLLIQMGQTFISNLVVNIWCDRRYLYLKEKVTEKYDKIPQFIDNVKNILIGRVGGFIYGSTDNLIISKFAGVIQVGYMSNYYQIQNVLKLLVSSITEPIQPMIGNYVHEYEDAGKSYDLFLAYTFIRFCFANILSVGMIIMINPLITIWLGKEYILSTMIPILMSVDMFIGIVHGPTGEFISVRGLFRNDKNMSLIGIFINLVFSIMLVRQFGSVGVLIGTVIAQTYYWVARACIVFSKYFRRGVLKYLFRVGEYVALTAVDIAVLNRIAVELFACMDINLMTFVLMGVVCVVVCVISIILCFYRLDEYKVFVDIMKKVLTRQ